MRDFWYPVAAHIIPDSFPMMKFSHFQLTTRSFLVMMMIHCGAYALAQQAPDLAKQDPDATEADLLEVEKLADEMNEKPVAISGDRRSGALPQMASLRTNSEARAFILQIPAPRGMFLDRNGVPLANNEVRYYPAVQFPLLKNPTDSEIIDFATKQVTAANRLLGTNATLKDDVVLKHYKNRRWLPLNFGSVIGLEQAEKVAKLSDGLTVQPVYYRVYPEKTLAAHMLGYAGRVGWFPDGPVEEGDPIWEQMEGKSGLEKSFEKDLRGTDGELNVLFDENGIETNREIRINPVPGNNVVLTIDAEWQKRAEKILEEKVRRGAMVVMNVRTGEVMAMASYPTFDPNVWFPSISTEDKERLDNDPAVPMLCRAYQSAYPPASTFKIAVAIAALDSGTISPYSLFPGPPGYAVGNRVFSNWNKNHEGDLDVAKAIARSTNTWFYRVGIMTGARPIIDVAQRFGMGSKVGLPLPGEVPGFVPDQAWADRYRNGRFSGGDIANMAIGQGALLVTPLQMAQFMSGVANGSYLPEAKIIKQVQDVRNNVVRAPRSGSQRRLDVDLEVLMAVRKGMDDVVNESYGTARRARLEGAGDVTVAGKTGTGQWKIAINQNVAWFTGFVPADNPEYAFAVLYEGKPGEKVSGGSSAAPLVSEFFSPIYNEKLKKEEERLDDDKKKMLAMLQAESERDAQERSEREALAEQRALENPVQGSDRQEIEDAEAERRALLDQVSRMIDGE